MKYFFKLIKILMEDCISCGKINKYFGYIFLSVLFKLLQDLAFGTNYNNSFQGLKLFEMPKDHYIIHDLFGYMVVFFSSLIVYKCRKNRTKNVLISKAESAQDQKEEDYSKKYFVTLLLIIILWVIEMQLKQLYDDFLKNLDFWMLELIIMFYFMKKTFNVELYKHQKLSFLIIIFPFIFKVGTIILSIISHDENDPGFLYIDYKLLIPIGIILYIILLISESYILTTIKFFMDIRFISVPKVLIYFGLFGSIIGLIIVFSSSHIKCPYFKESICQIKYIDHNNKTIYYLENYKIYFSDLKENIIKEIIINLLGQFSFLFDSFFSLLVIKYLSPIHKIFSIPLYFFSQKTLLVIINLCKEHTFFSKNKIKYIHWKFTLDITSDLVSIIGLMIYLEIIVFNFCDFNYDTRESISIRAIDDILSDSKEKDFLFLQNGDIEEITVNVKRKNKNKNNKKSIEFQTQ